MREILFRGKRTDNGEWVQGYIIVAEKDTPYIIPSKSWAHAPRNSHSIYSSNFYRVDPATVGQYTGLTDKNGTKIFEGDILKYPDYSGGTRLFAEQPKMVDVVKWNEKTASFTVGGNRLFYLVDTQKCEVIGNIHDKGGVIDE